MQADRMQFLSQIVWCKLLFWGLFPHEQSANFLICCLICTVSQPVECSIFVFSTFSHFQPCKKKALTNRKQCSFFVKTVTHCLVFLWGGRLVDMVLLRGVLRSGVCSTPSPRRLTIVRMQGGFIMMKFLRLTLGRGPLTSLLLAAQVPTCPGGAGGGRGSPIPSR